MGDDIKTEAHFESVQEAKVQPGYMPDNIVWAIFKNTGAQMSGHVFLTGLKYAAYILIFRSLGPETFGEYSLIIALLSYGEIVLDFGFNEIFVQDLSRRPEQKQHLLSVMTATKGLQTIAAYLLLTLMLFTLKYREEIIVAALIGGLEFFFTAGVLVFRGLFRAALVLERNVLAEIVSVTVFILLLFICCLKQAGLSMLFVSLIVSRLVFFMMCFLFGKDLVGRFRIKWDAPAMRAFFVNSLPVGLSMIMVGIYNSMDLLMLSKMDVWRSVGLYSAAYRFVLPLVSLPSALMGAMYPIFCSYWQQQMDRFHQLFQTGMNYVVLLAGAILCGVIAPADFLMGLFGQEAVQASPALRMLAFAIAIMSLSTMIGPMLVVMKRQWLAFIIGLSGAAINGFLNFLLIPKFSYMGAAFATLATEICVIIPAIVMVQRIAGYRLHWGILWRVFLPVAISLLIVRQTEFQDRFVGGLIALIVFLLGSLITGAIQPKEIKALLSSIRTNS